MAVFWSASGIAVGALIAFAPRIRPPWLLRFSSQPPPSSVAIGRNLGALSFAFGLRGLWSGLTFS
jgi:hypothetical protein